MHWILTAILLAQGLPTVPTWTPPEARRAQLAPSVVRVEVSLPKQKYITTFGDDGPRGAAVWVQPAAEGAEPSLLTAEFLIRGAASVRLRVGERVWPTKVLRSDARVGFALLECPPELAAQLTPAPLTQSELVPHYGFSIADDQLVGVAINGRGSDQLAWYWRAAPSLPGGHPIFDARGELVGLYAVQDITEPGVGFAIFGPTLPGFLAGPAKEPEPRIKPMELWGSGGRSVNE
jgi:hypothetical protein